MNEVLKYITMEQYEAEAKTLKDGETRIIYREKKIKIKLMKRGKKIYKILIEYGNIPIDDIARKLMVQA